MTIPLTFDFTPALIALDPHHRYTATPLSGGLVNITVRIHISCTTEEHECAFAHANSVIAKYAPAYVAALGERAPFSQYRQASGIIGMNIIVIEARALALLSQPSLNAYTQSVITTPKLIHHNPDLNILLMSDLGDAHTLDQWLCSDSIKDLDLDVIADIGRQFGEFFAHLGNIYKRPKTSEETSIDLAKHFFNPATLSFVRDNVILGVESNLLKCGIDPTDASALGKICLEAHERKQKPTTSKVFGLGDCWPKSLLIGGNLELGVVDWEFAGVVEPLADLAQISAHLYLLYQTSSVEVKPRVKAYTLAMLRAHYAQSPGWQYVFQHRVDAWVLLGQEVVNNAVETNWWGEDEARRQVQMKELVKSGSHFIRGARKRGAEEGALFEELFDELG